MIDWWTIENEEDRKYFDEYRHIILREKEMRIRVNRIERIESAELSYGFDEGGHWFGFRPARYLVEYDIMEKPSSEAKMIVEFTSQDFSIADVVAQIKENLARELGI